MNPWNIIQKLESNNSSLFKQDVIKANIATKEVTITKRNTTKLNLVL